MTATDTTTPPGTEWVTVKHVRFPIPGDTVLGHYSTYVDAITALNDLLQNRQWFTEYAIERRNK